MVPSSVKTIGKEAMAGDCWSLFDNNNTTKNSNDDDDDGAAAVNVGRAEDSVDAGAATTDGSGTTEAVVASNRAGTSCIDGVADNSAAAASCGAVSTAVGIHNGVLVVEEELDGAGAEEEAGLIGALLAVSLLAVSLLAVSLLVDGAGADSSGLIRLALRSAFSRSTIPTRMPSSTSSASTATAFEKIVDKNDNS